MGKGGLLGYDIYIYLGPIARMRMGLTLWAQRLEVFRNYITRQWGQVLEQEEEVSVVEEVKYIK